MKKIIFFTFCIFFATQTYSAQKELLNNATYADSLLDNVCLTSSIEKHTKETAKNTNPVYLFGKNTDYIIILLLTFLSAVFAFFSFYYSRKTAKNVDDQTQKQEIKKEFQKGIFMDIIRHLYRNKICVCAIHWKLKNEGFDKYYPSEEHLLKLKVLPEDLRLDRFDNTPKYYDKLHQLELFFRNYNIEVDVALEHLKMQSLPEKDKERDLVFTLEFKSQFLTQQIINLMVILEADKTKERIEEDIKEMIKKISEDYDKNNLEPFKLKEVPVREATKIVGDNNSRYRYYDDELGMTEYLDKAISYEYYKINLIKFT